jgi:hypothetical protein
MANGVEINNKWLFQYENEMKMIRKSQSMAIIENNVSNSDDDDVIIYCVSVNYSSACYGPGSACTAMPCCLACLDHPATPACMHLYTLHVQPACCLPPATTDK